MTYFEAEIEDKSRKIAAYNILVHQLPEVNFCLVRAISAFLIGVINNADVNKMTIRNVGIVFSPTLSIPAPVFAMFLTEFDAIFGARPANSMAMPTEITIVEPPTPEEIRSPRHQLFSDIPTPSYTQVTFPARAPSYEQVLRESHAEHDTGFIPLQPSYEPPTTFGALLYGQTNSGSVTMPGPEYGSNNRTLEPSSMQAMKARRRESSMLLMGADQRKPSMSSEFGEFPMLRKDPTDSF